jgi:probable F420-dependent oxidoreductase
MDIGLALPTGGPIASAEAIRTIADEAERIGLASLWTFERLLRPTEPVVIGGGAPVPVPRVYATVYEPVETLAYVAARTSRITLGTSVIDALFHPPAVLARRVATLDQLSGGRTLVGLGQGWMPQEFALVGVPQKRKGAGFDEHIAAMRAAWGPDPVRFDGRFYQIPESQINPKPVRPGGPPLLVGANTPPGARRAGRLGLGLNPLIGRNSAMPSLDALGEFVQSFRRAAEAAGHDPRALPVVLRVNGPVTAGALDEREPLTGSVEQVLEDLAALEDLGIDHVFWSMGIDLDQQISGMARLVSEHRR